MSVLGDRLRKAREIKKLNQTEVYKKTKINNKTLSRYEKGGSEPDLETLKILASLYDVSIDWLTGNKVNVEKLKDELQKISGMPKSEERKKKVADFMQEFLKLPEETQDNFYDLIKNMPKK